MTAKTDKKLAKQLAREQMLIQIRKDTLAREGALDEISLSKIKDKWFETLVDTKVPEMQDNLRHILHYMEKLIEADNFRKLLFEEERQELTEKCTLMAQSHGSALETLFDIYQKRVQDLHNAYSEMVFEKKSKAEEEFKFINDQENLTQENMHTMLYQMRENKEKKEEMMNCDMFLKLDDERSKNTEVHEYLQTKLEKKMEKRWGEISSTLNKYEESTKARRKEYILLKTKDDIDSKIIHQQMKKTQKLFEQLDELKKCMDDCYAPEEKISLIKDLREERMNFFSTFKQLKQSVVEELKKDELNLKKLTACFLPQITRKWKKSSGSGSQVYSLFTRIIHLLLAPLEMTPIRRLLEKKICRKFETQFEKIEPVGNPFNFSKAAAISEGRKKSKAKVEKEEAIISYQESKIWIKDFDIFEKFWRKVGKVLLSKAALIKYVETTEKENQLLKKILASYLKEVSRT